MIWLKWTLVTIFFVGAPAYSFSRLYEVHVDAFPDPERIIERQLPVCIDRNLIKNKLDTLEAKSMAQEIVEVCSKVAKLKGLNLVEASQGRNCLHIGFEWEVREAEKIQNCWKFFNSTFCSPHTNSKAYGKGLVMPVYDFGFRPAKQVSEIRSSMTSDNKSFTKHTAEVLCRAAFHDYPKRLKDVSYDVEPTLD